MNILFATSSFNGGGITSYAHEVISLYSQNNNMSVLIGSDEKSPISTPNVKIYKYNCNDTSLKNAMLVLGLINDVIKPDIIISSFASVIPLIAPYLAKNIRIITVSHSLRYIESDIAAFNNKYIDSIIALSASSKKYLDKQFRIKDKTKVKVVFNFVREFPDADRLRETKKKQNPITIVFPGGGAPTKSPDIVCKVLKQLLKTNLEFKFYWMGTLTPPLRKFQKIKYFADLFKKDDRLIFTGRLSRNEAAELISKANILLAPSRREGCPIALLEAMRVGCIPIVADYPIANSEIIHHKENGFIVRHDDINGFISIIQDIIKSHDKFFSIYDESFNTFENQLSFNQWEKHMDELINSHNESNNCRGNKFSPYKFRLDRLRLNIIKYYDLVHMLFSENFRSGCSIYIQSIKDKCKN